MKKILLFALPLLALLCTSCEEKWTDDSPIIEFTNLDFLSYLLKTEWWDGRQYNLVDRNGDGQISEKEASVVLRLSINIKLTSIEEIKYFTALKELYCTNNNLTTLDLSKNTALKELYCSDNCLTTLDISGCVALTELYCSENYLTTLDLSGCTALTELSCYGNQLTTLDLSGCIALRSASCENNPLEKIKINVNNKLPQEFINSYKNIIEYVK